MPIEELFKKKQIEINCYIEDANEEIGQFQFLDEGLLTSTFYNLIIIIVVLVCCFKHFQKNTFAIECVCDSISIFITLNFCIILNYGLKTKYFVLHNLQQS